MLAIPVDRDSSVAPGVWEVGGVGFFLRGCAEAVTFGPFHVWAWHHGRCHSHR